MDARRAEAASPRIRAEGIGERSSSRRARRVSSVESDTLTVTSCRSESRWSTSMSRVTSGDLEMIPIRRPRKPVSTSRMLRVSR